MIIRAATIEDAPAIFDIHCRSIRTLCAPDYTPEQVEAWVGGKTIENYIPRIKRDPTFVALINHKTVGFVRFYVPTSELASIFIDPNFARQGIGTTLMARAIDEAKQLDLTHFWLDGSITAVSFYKSLGFIAEKEIIHHFPTISIPGIRMTLHFS
ncbi:MAG: GNAT family N-acetyltransferase [Chloroflexi bacterium]|nr:MAG: GNAT family N-acetyltransferase [Chloroflexota bacterium]